MHDLKERAVRGGLAKLFSQAANFALRFAFLVVLARLLDPQEFGIVAMVTVVTGIYEMFTNAGLSSAAVQKAEINNDQISTLFWINVLVGVGFALLCVVTAPVLVAFYHEPRLFWITVAMGVAMIASGVGAQHSAILQRQLRYITLASVETLSIAGSTAVGIGMAFAGFSYWSLVGASIAAAVIYSSAAWIATGWVPGPPRRVADLYSMLRFGGTVTLNTLVSHVTYNFEKMLLGRFWGADALGVYGRASQLINIPTNQLNAAVGSVAFAALSRLQNEPFRLRRFFLKGYSLVISMTAPLTVFSALFADDIIRVVLGPKWMDAAMVFRLLTPTVLIFGIINPTGWLLISIGLQARSLALALAIAPLAIGSYLIGLPYGPNGVALAFSAAMTLWLIPHVYWSLHGTVVTPADLFQTALRPIASAAVAVSVAYAAQYLWHFDSPYMRLLFAASIMGSVYLWMLLFVMGQKSFYLDLLKGLKSTS
jgi:PST family polysaccharide transporter